MESAGALLLGLAAQCGDPKSAVDQDGRESSQTGRRHRGSLDQKQRLRPVRQAHNSRYERQSPANCVVIMPNRRRNNC